MRCALTLSVVAPLGAIVVSTVAIVYVVAVVVICSHIAAQAKRCVAPLAIVR